MCNRVLKVLTIFAKSKSSDQFARGPVHSTGQADILFCIVFVRLPSRFACMKDRSI